jgi:hypothetical protein
LHLFNQVLHPPRQITSASSLASSSSHCSQMFDDAWNYKKKKNSVIRCTQPKWNTSYSKVFLRKLNICRVPHRGLQEKLLKLIIGIAFGKWIANKLNSNVVEKLLLNPTNFDKRKKQVLLSIRHVWIHLSSRIWMLQP